MSGPILDLDTLRREYAVEGWTWVGLRGCGQTVLENDDTGTQVTVDGDEADLVTEDGCGTPVAVAITVACAHLGLPTPWRLAERLDDEGDKHYGGEVDCAKAFSFYHSAAMARGGS